MSPHIDQHIWAAVQGQVLDSADLELSLLVGGIATNKLEYES